MEVFSKRLRIKHRRYIRNTMRIESINSRQALSAVTLDNFQPFRLIIDTEELLCERLLRLIPHKRMVIKGVWRQQPVIVKLFFSKTKAQWHCGRECRGYEHLREQD